LCYLLQIHNIVFSVVKWSEQNLYIHLNNVGVHIVVVVVRRRTSDQGDCVCNKRSILVSICENASGLVFLNVGWYLLGS